MFSCLAYIFKIGPLPKVLWVVAVLARLSCQAAGADNAPFLIGSKEPVSYSYTQKNGLPDNNTYCIFQDQDQYLWFGTDNGVARFDGSVFDLFTTNEGLSDNAVISIQQDRLGRIWFLTVSGAPCFYKDGKIHNSLSTPFLKALEMDNFCSAFHEDVHGNLYFGSNSGHLLMLDTWDHVHSLMEPHINWGSLQMVTSWGRDSLVVINTIREYVVFTPRTRVQRKMHKVNLVGSEFFPIKSCVRSNGDIVNTWGRNVGVLHRDFRLNEYKNVVPGVSEGKILFVAEDQSKNIWLGTTLGAFRYANGDLECEPELRLAVGKQTQWIHEDHVGGLWVATTEGVIHYPDPSTTYLIQPVPQGSEHIQTFDPIGQDSFLVGTSIGGVYLYLAAQRSLKVLLNGVSQHPQPVSRVLGIDGKEWWILRKGSSLIYAEGKLKEVDKRRLSDMAYRGEDAYWCNSWGLYWACLADRLNYMHGSADLYYRKPLFPGRCMQVELDHEGNLVAASQRGIYVLREHVAKPLVKADSIIAAGQVTAMEVDDENRVWFGTQSSGVYVLLSDSLYRFDVQHGLSGNLIGQLQMADDSTMLIATNQGISRIVLRKGMPLDSARLHSIQFDLENPLVRQVSSQGDTLYACVENGVIALNKDSLFRERILPHPRIHALRSGGKVFFPDDAIGLPFQDAQVSLQFSAIYFHAHPKIEFRYRLEGLNEDWQFTRGRSITFSGLWPGEYRFLLQARSVNGAWSETTAELKFEILKPWYLWPAVLVAEVVIALLLFGLVLGGLVLLVRRRLDNRRRLALAEHRALILQMNPHFIFNSLQSIQNYFLAKDIETANDYMADFSQLMRAMLDSGRMQNTRLADELELLTLYLSLERMRTNEKFDYQVRVEEGIDLKALQIPPFLLQPSLENAIWHGMVPKEGKGLLDLHIERLTQHIQVSIADNGIGREQAKNLRQRSSFKHKSHATDIVMERLQLLNQGRRIKFGFEIVDLHDAQGQPMGTKVIFSFPISFGEHYD